MHKSASIGVQRARSLQKIFWRELLIVLLVVYVLLLDVQSCKNILAGFRFTCKNFLISLYWEGMSRLCAAWEEAPSEGLWLCEPLRTSIVQNLLITFLLVGTEPLMWKGQLILVEAFLFPKLFMIDPQKWPDQSYLMYTFLPGWEFDLAISYPWFFAKDWQNPTRSSIEPKRAKGGGSNRPIWKKKKMTNED